MIGQFLCLNTDVGGRQRHSVLRLRGYRWYAVWMWPLLRLRVSKNCDDQIPQIKCGAPSNLNPASKEMNSDSLGLCGN